VMSNTDNWTIMAWVRLDTIVADEYQFVAYNGDDSGGYGFCFYNGELRGLYGAVVWHPTDVTVTAETWNHVAMRRDSGTLQFYLNGKLLSYSYDSLAPNSPYGLFTLGNMIANNHMSLYADSLDGQIDEVTFWDKALSAQEIRDNMCQSLQGDKPGLAAYYRMDQQDGETTLYDQTPNGYNGTLINMFETGSATATGTNTLTNSSASWTDGDLIGRIIGITTSEKEQTRIISGNTQTQITVSADWSPTLSGTEDYEIYNWVSSSAFNTWIGSSSTAWGTATNWSRGAAPGSTDNVGIPDYSNTTGYPTGNASAISGTPTVNNLVLASDAAATLSSGMTVNGNLILENNLTLNNQAITLGSSGYLIENNGLLVGSSASDTGTIATTRTLNAPSAENVAGLGATLTSASNLGETTITRGVAAKTHGGNQGIKRSFIISPATNTGLNATLVFHWETSELNGLTESRLVLNKSTDSGSTWSQVSATLSEGNNTLTATGLDGFSWWTASDSDSPLLVDLVSFTVESLGNTVRLEWETASEKDTAGFHLWRSETSGGAYGKITQTLIPAEGGATSGASYTYEDDDVTPPQVLYYKLEGISNTGAGTFHGPVLGVVGDAAVKVVSGPTTIGEGDTAPGMGEIIIEGTGQHTVTTGKYTKNPAGAPTFTPTGDYWFVDVTDPAGLNSVTVRFCPAQSSNTVYYWDGAGWVSCSDQDYADGCIAVTITDSSTPKISDLTNLVFAMGSQSAAIPTVSEWGMIIFCLLLMITAIVVMRRRGLGLLGG
jgi:hypothetical protein